MNKKFSTLAVAAMLATAFTVNAGPGHVVTQLAKGNNGKQYQLRALVNEGDSWIDKGYLMVEGVDGKLTLAENPGDYLGKSLWCVDVTLENQGKNPIFDFINKGVGSVLEVTVGGWSEDTDNWTASGNYWINKKQAQVGGEVRGWEFTPVLGNPNRGVFMFNVGKKSDADSQFDDDDKAKGTIKYYSLNSYISSTHVATLVWDGETDASLAQEEAWQEYRDHWNEAWTAAKNASEGFTGEKCFKLARERFEKLRKEQVQKQQLIDIQLKQQIAVIQKKLTNINYSREKAKNLFLEFEQLSSVFVEWKIRRYNIVECFNPRYSPFPKLKEWKEFFSEVDFDNDPWWNRLKG